MSRFVALAAFAAALALSNSADAACFPARFFGQYPAPQGGYFYLNPTGTNTQASIVGRFWEVGAASSVNEGSCDASQWVLLCNAPYPCRGKPGVTRYLMGLMNGTTPHGVCKNTGCPTGELHVLVQDTNASGGAEFFLARVDRTPAALTEWDYSRLLTDLTYTAIPKPVAGATSRVGTQVRVDLTLPAANGGFYGLPGQAAAGPGNISGYRLFTFTGTADPGRARGSWVADTVSRPYTGGDVTVSAFSVDCSNTAVSVFIATALEFDGGSVTTDYVSQAVRIVCDPRTTRR